MPGRSRPAALSTVACTRTLRVEASTSGLIAVILPVDRVARDRVPRQPHREAFLEAVDLLLGDVEVDEDRVERLERDDRVARLEALAQVDEADAELARRRAP